MQPTIIIPQDWPQPQYWLGQRTKQGLIVGVEYYPPDTALAEEYGDGWRYAALKSKNAEDVQYYSDTALIPLSDEELQAELQAELEEYQQRITTIQQQLAAIGGSENA